MWRPAWEDAAVVFAILAMAVVLGYQTTLVPASAYAKVGPTVFPWAVTAMLALLGVVLTIQGLLGGWPHDGSTPSGASP